MEDDSIQKRNARRYTTFKAWWDVLTDYLVTVTGVGNLLIISRLASYDTGMLVCTHPVTNLSYGYSEGRYINSRCCRESNAWSLIYYPYIMFFTWMLISTVHLSWGRIPKVVCKIEAFSDILNGIFSTIPLYYRDPQKPFQITKDFVYDEVNSKKIEKLLSRLQYVLTEKPFLKHSYLVKHSLLMILCFLSASIGVITQYKWTHYQLSFFCNLVHDPPTRRAYPNETSSNLPTPCHLNSGFFILFIIHIDLFSRILIFVLSCRAVYWGSRIQKRNFLKNEVSVDKKNISDPSEIGRSSDLESDGEIFGEANQYLFGLPGFFDLLFCIELLKRNSHDGDLMYNSIRGSVRSYCKRFKPTSVTFRNKMNEPSKNDQKSIELSLKESTKLLQDNVYFVRSTCTNLGIEQIPNDMKPGHLFDCLKYMRDSLGIYNFDTNLSMRAVIAKEIQGHPELYKSLIDEDANFPDYETYCERIQKDNTYGSKYVLIAAATLYRFRIVLIHFYPVDIIPEVYNPLRQTVIEPRMKAPYDPSTNLDNENSSLPTRFMTFIEPHYYTTTKELPMDSRWTQATIKRSRYMSSSKFRSELKKSIMRDIGSVTDIGLFCMKVLGVENPDPLLFS